MVRAILLGASGYTGADLLRIGLRHPDIQFVGLGANTKAGKYLSDVFPHLAMGENPQLLSIDQIDYNSADVLFSGLPHGASQSLIKEILRAAPKLRIIDMSADYRLVDPDTYEMWYGTSHVAPDLQEEAVYGLTELYREKVRSASLVACPGCYPTASLLALQPLVAAKLISADDIIIDAKSGVSGAGRSLAQTNLFAEVGESLAPYKIGVHRHTAELEQELGLAAGRSIKVNFTPHLAPMSRGELITAYVKLNRAANAKELKEELATCYSSDEFLVVDSEERIPSTAHVRGSNYVLINAFDDRIPGRAIVVAAIDNLVKGSAGQAIQNFNVMFGFPENRALTALPLFP
jgi:N-acetyl-gamma-glutamyl-phosphate reductase